MSWLEVVGWAGSALLVWSLLQRRLLRLRIWNLIGSVILVGYNAVAEVWPMAALNFALAVINVWQLVSLLRSRHDERRYQVVEVATDDNFLAHVLRVHWSDIAKFNPEFRFDDEHRLAFLTLNGDEVVGVLMLRPDPADPAVALLELDYVTQRYRDLSPGEFVFRRSGQLTAHGFERVVTPPGMVAPYYSRLGFNQAGDRYVLDLTAH
ncbi:hypothetical protein Dvina_14925 [Dactylosporangium vinaceum]|uniref:N-acetyltransferase domain-containing protein n=1 Tax=Dactylosporangium vinaceum TaxID=53362 RepID=A0ABV5M1T4_9ACTN|nr:hypothetical protein [Dactylosporangium vinaceum]UAB99251.1 hypothetical protein Dvina_14925 [Dactylosporangium vinaceum]